MRQSTAGIVVACVMAMFVTGCASFSVKVKSPTPAADSALTSTKALSVAVTSSPALNADQQALLDKNDVPNKVQAAMLNALSQSGHVDATNGSLKVGVQITNFRMPWNPGLTGGDTVTVDVNVTDAAGTVVKTFSATSVSVRGGTEATRLTRIFSDVSQKVLDGV